MSDLRDQLRKAGLIDEKKLRQAKHEERLLAKKAGPEGIDARKSEAGEAFRESLERRRREDRKREEERRREEQDDAARRRIAELIAGGWIRDAGSGSRRFFFVVPPARISYLDLSDLAIQRLLAGTAAIVETRGHVRGEFCLVGARQAAELAAGHPEIVLYWNRSPGARKG